MNRRWTFAVVAVLLASASTAAAACRDDPELVGPCFPLRGRLFAANGAPTFRIWRVGTRRILGIHGDADSDGVPACLREHVGFDKELYADFVVCPYTRQRPGHMQFVCVDSASRMTVRDATQGAERRYAVEGTCGR